MVVNLNSDAAASFAGTISSPRGRPVEKALSTTRSSHLVSRDRRRRPNKGKHEIRYAQLFQSQIVTIPSINRQHPFPRSNNLGKSGAPLALDIAWPYNQCCKKKKHQLTFVWTIIVATTQSISARQPLHKCSAAVSTWLTSAHTSARVSTMAAVAAFHAWVTECATPLDKDKTEASD